MKWGITVQKARALYSNIEVVDYNDQYICSGGLNKNDGSMKEEIDLTLLQAITLDKIKVYPNPFYGQITIDYYLKPKENGAFIMYDITGVEKVRIDLSSMVNRTSFNVSSIPKGMYIYKYVVNNIMRGSGKLIKE